MVRGPSPGSLIKNSVLAPASRAECVGGVAVHLHAAAVRLCRQIDRVKVIIRL